MCHASVSAVGLIRLAMYVDDELPMKSVNSALAFYCDSLYIFNSDIRYSPAFPMTQLSVPVNAHPTSEPGVPAEDVLSCRPGPLAPRLAWV